MESKEWKLFFFSCKLFELGFEREKKIKNTSYARDAKLLLPQYVNEDHPSDMAY